MEDSNDSQTNAEVAALTAVVQALKTVPREDHRRIIDAALVLLGGAPRAAAGSTGDAGTSGGVPTDIRRLAELKQPKGASEMAALVAYYLGEVAAPAEHKDTFEIADMVKYFKQGKFKLPRDPAMILVRAKNAGYFDSAGAGKYRLNPVGYNLVVHSLPRANETGSSARGRSRARRQSRKTGRKS